MIIGIAGKKQSGKDTAAKIISLEIFPDRFQKYSFAIPVKEVVNAVFFWDKQHSEGVLKEVACSLPAKQVGKERIFNIVNHHLGGFTDRAMEIADGLYADIVETHTYLEDDTEVVCITPREAYQKFGTDVARHLDEDIWVNGAKHYAGVLRNFIIPDVRFDNEAEWIKNTGGIIIHLARPETEVIDTHASEKGIDEKYIDAHIDNDGTKDMLHYLLLKHLEDMFGPITPSI